VFLLLVYRKINLFLVVVSQLFFSKNRQSHSTQPDTLKRGKIDEQLILIFLILSKLISGMDRSAGRLAR